MAKVVRPRKFMKRRPTGEVSSVEKGVPIPRRVTNTKYPFATMQIDDSFTVPTGSAAAALRTAAGFYKIRNPEFNYTTRTEGDRLRIWRIKP